MTTDTLTPDLASRFGSGQSVQRLEDEALLKGLGAYTDDITPDGQLRLCFVRSPYPHARIVSIDTRAARAMPGVVQVTTGAELVAAGVKPIPGGAAFKRAGGAPGATPPRRVLAHERVRYVGEALVLVVAETMQQARDAAEAVMVEYDELPNVVNVDDATAAGAVALCDEAPDNIAAEMRHGNADATTAAFAQATHVVKLEIHNQRVAALAIEPRSVLAWVADDGRLEQVRVVVGDVGGGFGMKTGIYPEDRRGLGRAHAEAAGEVEADRSEEFLSACMAATCVAAPSWRWTPTARCWRCACARWPTWAPTPPAPAWPSSC
jgi:carbon-monoxide dehydrogenase large subunit